MSTCNILFNVRPSCSKKNFLISTLTDTLCLSKLIYSVQLLVNLMNSKLDVRDLRLIRHVAETGSLTTAANNMNVTQSAVSQRLAAIQARLKLPLFEKRGGIFQATAAGRRLSIAARRVDGEMQDAFCDIEQQKAIRKCRLRIATQCFTCYRWLPFVIRDVRNLRPSLTIDVVPDATDDPYDALLQDRIDVAIVSDGTGRTRLATMDLFADELYAVMASDHVLSKRSFLNAAQFQEQTLLLYSGKSHAILEQLLHPSGVIPARIDEIRITEAIVELARAGHGIAILSGWAFNDLENKSGLVAKRITRSGFKRNWSAVSNSRTPSDVVDLFTECVRQVGDSLRRANWRHEVHSIQTAHDRSAR
jgi:LysR family transcriptional regulator, regulator for metE and metH